MLLHLLHLFELYISFHTIWIMLLKKCIHNKNINISLNVLREGGKNAYLHIYVAHSWPLKLEELRSMMMLYTQ